MITLTITLTVWAWALPTNVALADGTFLCSPSQGAASATDAGKCVNRIYNMSIVVASIAAIVMIVIAGYLYMFSGGREDQTSKAKSLIISSLGGIVILLTGFLLLKQINPNLLLFKGISPTPIQRKEWVLPDGTLLYSDIQPSGTSPIGDQGNDLKQCPEGRQTIPTSLANRAGEVGCKSLIDALGLVKAQADTISVKFTVTDAYGPNHASLCHIKYGTCADLVPTNQTADSWNRLCKAIKATGRFRILNEYKGGGAPECGAFKQTTLTSGNHLHIILQGSLDDI